MFFWDNFTLEDWTNWFSQNSGMDLPLTAANNPRREQVSKHVQFQCVLLSGKLQTVEYKHVL